MQNCFWFTNRDDAIKVEEHLRKQFAIRRTDFLDNDILSVHEENYEEAITEGINFIIANNITTATWMDVNTCIVSIHNVPLLSATISPRFTRNKYFPKLIKKICCKYAHNFQKLLGVPVIFEENECEFIEFYLIRSKEVINNHKLYTEKLFKYLCSHKHFFYTFNKMRICDAYGKLFRSL